MGIGGIEDWHLASDHYNTSTDICYLFPELSAVLTFLTILLVLQAPAATQAIVRCASSISFC